MDGKVKGEGGIWIGWKGVIVAGVTHHSHFTIFKGELDTTILPPHTHLLVVHLFL